MNVRLTPAADVDVTRAYFWYEERKDGLGLEFLERVEQATRRIVDAPLGHEKVIRDARKCELERFPYALGTPLNPKKIRYRVFAWDA